MLLFERRTVVIVAAVAALLISSTIYYGFHSMHTQRVHRIKHGHTVSAEIATVHCWPHNRHMNHLNDTSANLKANTKGNISDRWKFCLSPSRLPISNK